MPELEFRPDECEWFENCTRDAVGMAAHHIYGVIPICQVHVDLGTPLINKPKLESE